jgi:hypothetical protein
MKINQVAAIAAFCLLAAPPMISLAGSATTDPIAVTNVEVQPTAYSSGTGFVSVSFTNTSNVTATEVVFELSSETSFQRIHDVGRFAPGVQIRHAYLDYSRMPDQQVKVTRVDFADGTIWANGYTTAPRSRRQASSNEVSSQIIER